MRILPEFPAMRINFIEARGKTMKISSRLNLKAGKTDQIRMGKSVSAWKLLWITYSVYYQRCLIRSLFRLRAEQATEKKLRKNNVRLIEFFKSEICVLSLFCLPWKKEKNLYQQCLVSFCLFVSLYQFFKSVFRICYAINRLSKLI